MPTPTPSATSLQAFSCCCSVYDPLTPLSIPFLPLCVTSSCSDPPWNYIPHKRLEHWAPPKHQPQLSLPLQGHSSFALPLCCAGKRALSQKGMCCSLPGSPLSPHWRTLTSQTGLGRCRKEGCRVGLYCREKGQSGRDNDTTVSLGKSDQIQEQIAKTGMDSPSL